MPDLLQEIVRDGGGTTNHPEGCHNTALFLMGDHGKPHTAQQRLPLLTLVLPRCRFSDEELGRLRANQQRLVSHIDLRRTMLELAGLTDADIDIGGRVVPSLPDGRSLLGPIPRDRSCADAGLDRNHCCCTARWESVPASELVAPWILRAATAVVANFNGRTERFRAAGCAELHLDKITQALMDVSADAMSTDTTDIERAVDLELVMLEGVPRVTFRVVVITATSENENDEYELRIKRFRRVDRYHPYRNCQPDPIPDHKVILRSGRHGPQSALGVQYPRIDLCVCARKEENVVEVESENTDEMVGWVL